MLLPITHNAMPLSWFMSMSSLAQIHPILPTGKPLSGLKAVPSRGCHGFTLLEILVAMLVVALGILGVVATNVASIKMQADSANRALAGLYAQDILDRMRANKKQALGTGGAPGPLYNRSMGQSPPTPPLTTLASKDLSSWFTNLQRGLPAGDAAITVTSAGNVTVTIQWNERENRGSSAATVSVKISSIL